MKVKEPSANIINIKEYKKVKPVTPDTNQAQVSTPARITDFSLLRLNRPATLSQEEVRELINPNGNITPKQETKEEGTLTTSLKTKIVDFETLSSLFPNVKKSNERALIDFMLNEGFNLTYEQAQKALEQYKNDAIDAARVFDRVEKCKQEFEERIQDLDFSHFEKITSIYKKKDMREMIANYETPDSFIPSKKKDMREMIANYETPDSFIPSKKSSRVSKNIAKLYVEMLKKTLPDYDIEVQDDGTTDDTNNIIQVSVTKGSDYMMFFFEDFISTLKNKKIPDRIQYYFENPENDRYSWHYDGIEKTMSKINKIFHGAVGTVSKDFYDNGKPIFYIDTEMESGPTFYAYMEINKPKERVGKNIDDTGNMTQDEVKTVKDIISNDHEAEKFYREYGLQFVNSCIREGKFSLQTGEAMALLVEMGEYLSADGEISLDYIKELISHVEEKEKNYHIDDEVFGISHSFLTKELNSNENHHKVIFDIIDYVKAHPSERVFDFAENLADELFSFEEVESIMKMINSSTPKKQTLIIQKVNKLVRELDASGELKPETRLYDQLIHELHLD